MQMNGDGYVLLQDLFCIMVATTAVSLLLVDLSSVYVAQQELNRQKGLDNEARRLCNEFTSYPRILHEEKQGLLENEALDSLNVTSLQSDLRIAGGFMMTVTTATYDVDEPKEEWTWSTGIPQENKGVYIASASIWFSNWDVRPARLAVWTWSV